MLTSAHISDTSLLMFWCFFSAVMSPLATTSILYMMNGFLGRGTWSAGLGLECDFFFFGAVTPGWGGGWKSMIATEDDDDDDEPPTVVDACAGG